MNAQTDSWVGLIAFGVAVILVYVVAFVVAIRAKKTRGLAVVAFVWSFTFLLLWQTRLPGLATPRNPSGDVSVLTRLLGHYACEWILPWASLANCCIGAWLWRNGKKREQSS